MTALHRIYYMISLRKIMNVSVVYYFTWCGSRGIRVFTWGDQIRPSGKTSQAVFDVQCTDGDAHASIIFAIQALSLLVFDFVITCEKLAEKFSYNEILVQHFEFIASRTHSIRVQISLRTNCKCLHITWNLK